MRPHRKSYLKGALTAVGVSAVSFGLAAYWLFEGQARIPLTSWTLFESRPLSWVLIAVMSLLGLLGLFVAVGGFFALHEDAKEGRRR